MAYAAIHSKAMVLLLLIHCIFMLSLFVGVLSLVRVLLFRTLCSSFAIVLMGKSMKKMTNPQTRKPFGLTFLRKDNIVRSALKDNDRLFNTHKDKANILNHQYQSTFTKEDDDQIPSPSGTPYHNMGEIDGIRKFLQKTNPRKATGPDGIDA